MTTSPSPTLGFLGATDTVTGSRFLVRTGSATVLVDCGLYQGLKDLRLRNWAPFPVPAAEIDAVVLTHAHVDHSGYLPALAAAGFTGPVVTTAGTADLCAIVLPDSGHLQEEEAAYANRKGFSKHHPARALYTEEDARRCLAQFRPVDYATPTEVAPGILVTFRRAGHILGSASVSLDIDGRRAVLVSGDLGRQQHPFLAAPDPLDPATAASTVLIESTYGDREHAEGDAVEILAKAVVRTARRGGTMVVPSFAVDRTEVLLYHLRSLITSGRVPELPIYVDSPMALAALAVYRRAINDGSFEIRPEYHGRADVLEPPGLHEVHDVEASKRLHANRFPSIIISASGMATGGRVLHHLAHRLPDPRNTVLLPGFQAAGTRGRALADGARTVKLLGTYVPVRAEVVDLPAFSVHAGRSELLGWLRAAGSTPEVVYVVHGEPTAASSLAAAITDELGLVAVTPVLGERVRI